MSRRAFPIEAVSHTQRICDSVLAAVQAKHPDASLVVNSVTNGGRYATVIRGANKLWPSYCHASDGKV